MFIKEISIKIYLLIGLINLCKLLQICEGNIPHQEDKDFSVLFGSQVNDGISFIEKKLNENITFTIYRYEGLRKAYYNSKQQCQIAILNYYNTLNSIRELPSIGEKFKQVFSFIDKKVESIKNIVSDFFDNILLKIKGKQKKNKSRKKYLSQKKIEKIIKETILNDIDSVKLINNAKWEAITKDFNGIKNILGNMGNDAVNNFLCWMNSKQILKKFLPDNSESCKKLNDIENNKIANKKSYGEQFNDFKKERNDFNEKLKNLTIELNSLLEMKCGIFSEFIFEILNNYYKSANTFTFYEDKTGNFFEVCWDDIPGIEYKSTEYRDNLFKKVQQLFLIQFDEDFLNNKDEEMIITDEL